MIIEAKNLPPVRGKYREKADLSKMCWFGVGGCADVFFTPSDLLDLQHFLVQINKEIPMTIFGVGSNILFRDGGIRGVLIRLGGGFNYIKHNNYDVTVGAAVMDINVAQYAAVHNIAGLEFLAGIPGTIGGALNMNAGAYNGDINEILISALAVNMRGEVKKLSKEEIGYKYRSHSLKEDLIFVEALLKGYDGSNIDIFEKVAAIQNARKETQPIKSKTGGSTFKNPAGLSAWKLIDESGCRGLTIGGASVSSQHCNFFINNGSATAADLERLIIAVKERVFVKTGVTLEQEIKIFGEKF